jgi:hypothetical protein
MVTPNADVEEGVLFEIEGLDGRCLHPDDDSGLYMMISRIEDGSLSIKVLDVDDADVCEYGLTLTPTCPASERAADLAPGSDDVPKEAGHEVSPWTRQQDLRIREVALGSAIDLAAEGAAAESVVSDARVFDAFLRGES